MTTLSRDLLASRDWMRDLAAGAAGGIAGGVVFGALMAMMGMLPMVGMLVGREDAVVGFGVHMVISLGIGLGYAVVLGGLRASRQLSTGWLTGGAYGFVWWILGPLLLMPTMLGMGPMFAEAFSEMNLMSLMGHLAYGVVLGLVFAFAVGRRGGPEPRP
jgi:uncharacterized membrane protein YagU involved in acid resistance